MPKTHVGNADSLIAFDMETAQVPKRHKAFALCSRSTVYALSVTWLKINMPVGA